MTLEQSDWGSLVRKVFATEVTDASAFEAVEEMSEMAGIVLGEDDPFETANAIGEALCWQADDNRPLEKAKGELRAALVKHALQCLALAGTLGP